MAIGQSICQIAAAALLLAVLLPVAQGWAQQVPLRRPRSDGWQRYTHGVHESNPTWNDPVDWGFSGQELREVVRRIAQTQGIAIWLDRRVDSSQVVNHLATGVALHQALEGLAAGCQAGVTVLDSAITFRRPGGPSPPSRGPLIAAFTVYLGSVDRARQLRTQCVLRRRDVAQLPPALAGRLELQAPWTWDDLAEPRQLAADLAAEAKLAIENPEAIPHDLWAQNSLPPLPLVDRLTLLGWGFDQTFRVDKEGHLTWVPVETPVVWQQTYRPAGNLEEAAAAWRALAPEAQITVEGNQLLVVGTVEMHERLGRRPDLAATAPPVVPGRPQLPARPGPGRKRFSLRVRSAPIEQLVPAVAQRLGLELDWDPAGLQTAGVDLKRRVGLEVSEVTQDELLHATGQACDLELKVEENRLRVSLRP